MYKISPSKWIKSTITFKELNQPIRPNLLCVASLSFSGEILYFFVYAFTICDTLLKPYIKDIFVIFVDVLSTIVRIFSIFLSIIH